MTRFASLSIIGIGLVSILSLSSQSEPTLWVTEKDPGFRIEGEILLYGEVPFDGNTYRTHPNGMTSRRTPYSEGRKNGVEAAWHPNGVTSSIRPYFRGQKVGRHEGFFSNGNRRFRSNYDEMGDPVGKYREWHPNGRIAIEKTFYKGRAVTQKTWRPSGQIYANTVLKNGRLWGLPGDELCVNTEDQK